MSNRSHAPNGQHENGSLINKQAWILAKAFKTDPFYRYITFQYDDATRISALLSFFTTLINYTKKFGRIITDAKSEAAVSLWLGPKSPQVNDTIMFFSGLYRFLLHVNLVSIKRLIRVTHQWHRIQAQVTKEHYYLLAMGVAPDHQRQGIGIQCIAPVLAESDQKRIPCYLETSNLDNTYYYQKLGFQVIQHASIDDDLAYWCMLRMPQA